jgi:hypothetical protein
MFTARATHSRASDPPYPLARFALRWARASAVVPLLCAAACASDDAGGGAGTGGAGAGGAGASGRAGSAGAAGAASGSSGGGGDAGAGGASAGAGRGGSAGAATGGGGGGGLSGGGNGGGGAAAGTSSSGAGSGGTAGAAGASGAGGGGRAGAGGSGGSELPPVSLTLLDEAVFFDGYASRFDEPLPAGVERLRNDLLTRKLSDAELDAMGNTLRVEVVIGALCDNYDRIGSVALAFVPKGEATYAPEDVERIEVGRYITPFMDMNREPDEVSYEFAADQLVPVLRDPELRAEFDLWFELELFGVPYAANEEVSGCADRSDVFRGTLMLHSDSSAPAPVFDELIPLAYKQAFNDYREGASDAIGTTRKTLEFELAAASSDAQLVLITSNHGANSGGEEYVRRDHFVYVDDELLLTYKPGRMSCEPFRMVNTQANGIYGPSPRSDSEWQSFSNWCPGDVIDTRIIPLGPLDAGSHEFVIDVPDAEFVGDEGNIPLSLYVQTRG